MIELNKIYNGDAREVMKDIEDNTIDCIVTSAPYDNLRNYSNPSNSWNFSVFQSIAKEFFRILKDGGVVVWVVNDKVEKGSKTLTSFKQALFFKEIGFNVNDIMIWYKGNPMPQVAQPRYLGSYEYMMIFSKGKPKTFNPIMRKCVESGKHYTSTVKNMGGESGRRDIDYFVNEETVEHNLWKIGVAQNKRLFEIDGEKVKHPAVFPYQIAYNHVKTWTNEGDVVLDPFVGSGTTALACINLKRNYIGIDINETYCKMSQIAIDELKKEKNL